MGTFNLCGAGATRKKKSVVVVMGATGTGKTKLSLNIADRFPAEVINSDKIQVYRGLDVVTNKVTDDEIAAVPHHLLGVIDDPDADFTASDFRHYASRAVESILERGRLPIIAGGSNSFLKALIDDGEFRCKYDCCFLWVDVKMPVLHSSVNRRVDKMVEAGLVEEVRQAFRLDGDYSSGIRRAIGVPEMDKYFRGEASADEATRAKLLDWATEEIKANTRKLACCQLEKIHQLAKSGWDLHRLDATEAFQRNGGEAEAAWERLVAEPSVEIVRSFLCRNDNNDNRDLGMAAIACSCSANATLVTAAAAGIATTVTVAEATC